MSGNGAVEETDALILVCRNNRNPNGLLGEVVVTIGNLLRASGGSSDHRGIRPLLVLRCLAKIWIEKYPAWRGVL
jgi:hypothetical protein